MKSHFKPVFPMKIAKMKNAFDKIYENKEELKMKKLGTFKIKFADDLGNWITTIEGRTVKVKTLNGEVLITAREDEDVNELRNKVHELIKGTPCNVEDVNGLL